MRNRWLHGTLQAKGVLLEGLKRLEYRGYDSAGIAVEDGRGINVVKRLGKVSGLADAIQDDMCQGTCGHWSYALGDAWCSQRAQRPSAHRLHQ